MTVSPLPATQGFDSLPNSAVVSAKVAAQVMGVSMATIWRMAKVGTLTPRRVGQRNTRFLVAEIRQRIGQ